MAECCVCKQEIVKRHPSPEGVMICSEECYKQWRTIITSIQRIKELIHYQPKGAKEKHQDKCLENCINWVSTYEKQKNVEYIK